MFLFLQTGKALNRKLLFLFSAFCFFPLLLSAQLDPDKNCLQAYLDILNLQFPEAQRSLAIEKTGHPSNLTPVYLENYIDFLTTFIKEEQPLYDQFKKDQDRRMKILGKADQNSPFYHYYLGNMHLQFAILKGKFGEYKSAAFEFNHAYNEFELNRKKYPGFLPDDAGLGLVHVLAAVVPESYSWVLKLFGIKGNVQLGLSEISGVAEYAGPDESVKICRLEALFYLSFIDSGIGKNAESSLSILHNFENAEGSSPLQASPLFVFVKVSILSRSHRNDEVLQTLESYQANPSGFRFCYLDYLTGLAKLNHLDYSADRYFIRFIKDFRGRNYIKAAYQKLAWCCFLNGESQKYEEYMKLAVTRGNAFIDADRQALREGQGKQSLNIFLLKARLLYDGGYNDLALHELLDHSVREIVSSSRDLLEYQYRLGRIYQESGDLQKALGYYEKTIQEGKVQPYYYAANAALQCGLIYEGKKDFQNAGKYFRICISLDYPEYKTSFDQKAKAGLQRIKSELP